MPGARRAYGGLRCGVERQNESGALAEREVERNDVRRLVARALLERRAVAGGEECEAEADEQERRRGNRARGCPGEREQRQPGRQRPVPRQALGAAHQRAEQAAGGNRRHEADEPWAAAGAGWRYRPRPHRRRGRPAPGRARPRPAPRARRRPAGAPAGGGSRCRGGGQRRARRRSRRARRPPRARRRAASRASGRATRRRARPARRARNTTARAPTATPTTAPARVSAVTSAPSASQSCDRRAPRWRSRRRSPDEPSAQTDRTDEREAEHQGRDLAADQHHPLGRDTPLGPRVEQCRVGAAQRIQIAVPAEHRLGPRLAREQAGDLPDVHPARHERRDPAVEAVERRATRGAGRTCPRRRRPGRSRARRRRREPWSANRRRRPLSGRSPDADPDEVNRALVPGRAATRPELKHLATGGHAGSRQPARRETDEPGEIVETRELHQSAADAEPPEERPAQRRLGRQRRELTEHGAVGGA